MRDLSAAYLEENAKYEREIGVRATFRKTLLSFNKQSITEDYPVTVAQIKSHDSDMDGTAFVRACLVELTDTSHDIAVQYVTDPTSTPWQTWRLVGDAVMDGCFPAVFEDRVFYQDDTGAVLYVDVTASTISSPTTVFSPSHRIWIAPVSLTEFYYYDIYTEELFYRDTSNNEYQFNGRVYGNSSFYDTTIALGDWTGRDVLNSPYTVGMDAVRDAASFDYDVIYITCEDGHSAFEIKSWENGAAWSAPKSIMPLDNVDDDVRFDMTGANVIDSKVFITGILVRPSGVMMLAYTIGPDAHTMGRDMFISADDVVTPRAVDDTDIVASGGEMHLRTDDVWYLSPDGIYKATGTIMVGKDLAASKTTTSDIYGLSIQGSENSSYRLSFNLIASASHAAIAKGSEIMLEFSLNDDWETFGYFGVETIVESEDEEGQALSIGARSDGIRRLSQWESDAYYDHWSQSKHRALGIDGGDLVHIAGTWDVTSGVLSLTSLNNEGWAYSPKRISRGRLVRAKFQVPSGNSTPDFGLFCSYRQSTDWYSAGNYDIATPTHNAIAAVVKLDTEYLHIYLVSEDAWTSFDSVDISSLNIPYDEDFWLQMTYQNARVIVNYRLDSSSGWTEIYDDIFTDDDLDALPDGAAGRGGIYAKNITAYATTNGIVSDTTNIGVDDNSEFSVSDVLIMDDERMTISAKSANTTGPADLEWVEEVAPTTDGGFSGYPICFDATGRSDLDYAQNAFDDLILTIKAGPGSGKAYVITDYDKWDGEDVVRVFVSEEPSSILGTDTVADIVPAITVTRGTGGTTVATHPAGDIHVYATNYVEASVFETYSEEIDMSFAEMARILCKRSGVLSPISRVFDAETQEFIVPDPDSGWQPYLQPPFCEYDPSPVLSTVELIARRTLHDNDFVMEIGALPETGYDTVIRLYFGMDTNGDDGCYLELQPNSMRLYNRTDSVVMEDFPVAYPLEDGQGWYRVSLYEGQLAVWANGQQIHVFDVGDPSDDAFTVFAGTDMSLEAYLPGGGTAYDGPFLFRWYRLDDRLDNFVMDMGARGAQLLSKLIGEKRIYFRDTATNGTLIYRDRDVVATSVSPLSLTVAFATFDSDTELKNRALIEGAHIIEILDKDSMRDHGNLFGLINSTELMSKDSLTEEARSAITDMQASASNRSAYGMADLRVEPGDVAYVLFDAETEMMQILAVKFNFAINQEGAVFDMDLVGMEYYDISDAELLVSDNTDDDPLGGNLV